MAKKGPAERYTPRELEVPFNPWIKHRPSVPTQSPDFAQGVALAKTGKMGGLATLRPPGKKT